MLKEPKINETNLINNGTLKIEIWIRLSWDEANPVDCGLYPRLWDLKVIFMSHLSQYCLGGTRTKVLQIIVLQLRPTELKS